MVTPIQSLRDMGQSVWYDDISRAMIKSGALQELIDAGVTGLTSNPTIFHKAITESSDYDDELMSLAEAGKGPREIFETMAIADIRDAADLLRPVFDGTGGADGFASFEVSPRLAHDTDGTIHEARRLFSDIDRPNIMIKVPATPEGIPAIETLIGEGINVNVTLIFSLESHRRVVNAYISGLERLKERGGDLSTVSSVASFFVSRVDTAVDNLLDGLIAEGRDDVKPLLGRAAVANAHLAYTTFAREFGGPRFAAYPKQRRSCAASSLGEHQRQEPCLRRPALRAKPHGAGHRQHDAASDHRHPHGAGHRRTPRNRRRGGRGRGTGAGRTQQRGNRHGRRHVRSS